MVHKLIYLSLVLALLGSVAAESEAETNWHLGKIKANRVLFLGNSLTLHGPRPDIKWFGNWGMAATAADKDFVHLLTSAISRKTRGKLVLDPADSKNEQGVDNIRNIAALFEQGYRTYESAKIERQLRWKPDIVVIQFGENVPAQNYDAEAMEKAFKALLKDLKNVSDPHIFVTGNILWGNTGLDDLKKRVCAEDPSRRTFVAIPMYAADVPKYGPVGHPNDLGMKLIADTLFTAVLEQAGTK